jgi:predicted ArsR family transcriptional regulator
LSPATRYQAPMSPARLASARARVLAMLKTQGRPMTRGELYAYVVTGVSPADRVVVLDGLEADGLVTVEEVPSFARGRHGRSYLYRLTPEGAKGV